MRAPTSLKRSARTRAVLAGVVMAATAALVSCSNTTDGAASCDDGCRANAEPAFPTPRPSVSTPAPPIAAPPVSPPPAPGPAPTAAPPPGAEVLPSNGEGYVYVTTKSGKTRCQLNRQTVGCESEFQNSPVVDGAPANGVRVTSDGSVEWILGNLGNIPVVTLDYRTYQAAGWTITADSEGTRFTNDGTGHGMFVAIEGVETF